MCLVLHKINTNFQVTTAIMDIVILVSCHRDKCYQCVIKTSYHVEQFTWAWCIFVHIYVTILLKSVCRCSQSTDRTSCLSRLGRYLIRFASTVVPFSHVFGSVWPSRFFHVKKPQNERKKLVFSWSPVTRRNGNNLNGDNCCHNGDI